MRIILIFVGMSESKKMIGKIEPFLRWAGGKRWLISNYQDLIPLFSGKYIEPFVGSGAMLFHLQPNKSIISDINEDLISVYLAIKQNHQKVSNELNDLRKASPDYYSVRSWSPTIPEERAARFIFLNRTCWNGLYRVNQRGEFNVPKGTKSIEDYPVDDFSATAELLKGAEIFCMDFKKTIGKARRDDFIFSDPPYTVRHNKNGFVKYNEQIFSWENQVELSRALTRAAYRGCHVMCTNASHSSIRELYSDSIFELREVSRYSSISSDTSSRAKFEELIIKTK